MAGYLQSAYDQGGTNTNEKEASAWAMFDSLLEDGVLGTRAARHLSASDRNELKAPTFKNTYYLIAQIMNIKHPNEKKAVQVSTERVKAEKRDYTGLAKNAKAGVVTYDRMVEFR